jgi:hypothetical protein
MRKLERVFDQNDFEICISSQYLEYGRFKDKMADRQDCENDDSEIFSGRIWHKLKKSQRKVPGVLLQKRPH